MFLGITNNPHREWKQLLPPTTWLPSAGSSDLCQELLDHRNSPPLTSPMSTAGCLPGASQLQEVPVPLPLRKPTPSSPAPTWSQRPICRTGESCGSLLDWHRRKPAEKELYPYRNELPTPSRLQLWMPLSVLPLIVGLRPVSAVQPPWGSLESFLVREGNSENSRVWLTKTILKHLLGQFVPRDGLSTKQFSWDSMPCVALSSGWKKWVGLKVPRLRLGMGTFHHHPLCHWIL